MPEIDFHPVAEIFPMMSAREFDDLLADIRDHGVREPVWLHRDGRIIDGRNRWRACAKLGDEPPTRTFEGDDGELVEFVLSLNLHRRHLNESQRAMVAAKVATLRLGANQHREGAEISAPSQQQAAGLLGVSRDSVRMAKKVQSVATPELATAVESGEVAVSAAAIVASVPAEKQRDLLAARNPRAAIAAVAREIKADQNANPEKTVPPRLRRPLPDQMRDAAYLVLRQTEAVHRLTEDDRWKNYAPKIDPATRENLRGALALLNAVVSNIPTITEETE